MTRRRPSTQCEHTSEVRLEIAGLVRSVCESCGRVSVDVVEDRFRPERLHEPELTISPTDSESDDR